MFDAERIFCEFVMGALWLLVIGVIGLLGYFLFTEILSDLSIRTWGIILGLGVTAWAIGRFITTRLM